MPVSHSHQLLCVSAQAPARLGHEHGLCRIGDIPDFVAGAAERAQQIHRVRIALGQRFAVADARHLRAAALAESFLAGKVREIFRLRRIGDVDDRGAVELRLSAHRVHRPRHVGRSAMVADIGDIAVALLVDGRLVGAARLQVVHADEAHVPGLGRIADLGRLSQRGRNQQDRSKQRGRKRERTPAVSDTRHREPPQVLSFCCQRFCCQRCTTPLRTRCRKKS